MTGDVSDWRLEEAVKTQFSVAFIPLLFVRYRILGGKFVALEAFLFQFVSSKYLPVTQNHCKT